MTSIYDGQFGGNVLVVGRTGCGKTTFLEKLGINKFFGDLVKTEWISRIDIDKKREAKIRPCLVTKQKYMWQKNRMNLILIETFKLSTHDIPNENDVNSLFGENKKKGSSYCYGRRFWCC